MELGYGEPAAKREKPYSAAAAIAGGEDRLSALPDDILIQILLRVVTVDAARTSVLSRRWRRLWCLLPEFEFGPKAGGHIIRAALAPHEYLSLLQLVVNAEDSSPGPMAEWLPVAARRLSGDLFLSNFRSEDNDEDLGFVELPCFGSATSLSLDLDFLALTKPASGVFTRLTDLYLCNVRFHGPCWLGDAVSSPRSPSLKKLTIQKCQGLSNFIIHSESLLQLDLDDLRVLRCLNVVAPALKMLNVFSCFDGEPTANISAPTLEILVWTDTFDPSSVQFSKMENLKQLDITYFDVFGQQADSMDNHNCLRLLQRFQFDAIPSLSLMLFYPSDLTNHEYLMEDMTVLPDIVYLNLSVAPYGHVIGPSLFHVLRMCTGVRRLKLVLDISGHLEAEAVCEPECVCDLPPNWTSEELVLNLLHEVEITNLRGTENEIASLKWIFSWAAVLKEMTINFYCSITESTAKELCKELLSFSRPEIEMKFYIDHGGHKVLFVCEE